MKIRDKRYFLLKSKVLKGHKLSIPVGHRSEIGFFRLKSGLSTIDCEGFLSLKQGTAKADCWLDGDRFES